jgi:pyruvate-ferredoxin/flavodoxin oxidoreductase
MVALAEERLDLWDELRELAGLRVSARVRARIEAPLEERLERELAALTEEYEMKIAQLEERYPALIARRIAEALVARKGSGLSLLRGGAAAPLPPREEASSSPTSGSGGRPSVLVGAELASAGAASATPGSAALPSLVGAELVSARAATTTSAAAAPEADESLDPWIESELCTTCNECTNLNPKIFAYNADKQAYIKDPRGGPFSDIVKAAERCTAKVIHPGTPWNPKEPDLDKWIKRAEPFQ